MKKPVIIIGGGLAGSEACWQLISRGIPVHLYEMRPTKLTKAHKTGDLAELVCSNSFRGAALSNAVGLLKQELVLGNSLVMETAMLAQVPAGGALAVDRAKFSSYISEKIKTHPLVTFFEQEICNLNELDQDLITIVATGPLTSPELARNIEELVGAESLAFFDAISPILFRESIDLEAVFRQSRYDKGGDDYLNIGLNKEQYEWFINEVDQAEKYTGNQDVENDSLDKLRPFEGCMPIEDMIARGPDTLRHGPFKPKGLRDPKTGCQPWAVLQLRQDDTEGELWSMVGMQTRMKRHEQERIFKSLPGLQKADFVRYGTVHRNTFINSPTCLDSTLQFRKKKNLFFAGQITGVEGYVESTAGGMVAGINAALLYNDHQPVAFPIETATGSLINYISDPERKDFQPMNISFGLMSTYLNEPKDRKVSKQQKREKVSLAALAAFKAFLTTHGIFPNNIPRSLND